MTAGQTLVKQALSGTNMLLKQDHVTMLDFSVTDGNVGLTTSVRWRKTDAGTLFRVKRQKIRLNRHQDYRNMTQCKVSVKCYC